MYTTVQGMDILFIVQILVIRLSSNMTLNTDTLRLYSTASAVHIGNLNNCRGHIFF